MNRPIVILTCADGFFGQGLKVWDSLCVPSLRRYFEELGYDTEIRTFEEVARDIMMIREAIVFYSSTQKPGYKAFIEDVLAGISHFDNEMIPSLDMFRAHENKGFQEIMRQIYGITDPPATYHSHTEGALTDHSLVYPKVYKRTGGSRSNGVFLVRSAEELRRRNSRYEELSTIDRIKRFVRTKVVSNDIARKWYEHIKPFHPFVLQDFRPGVDRDYKVLAFWDKFFVLERSVRNNDFRASGSGRLRFIEAETDLLDFANTVFKKFDVPFLSMDILKTDDHFELLEFQGAHFGPHTAVKSAYHYVRPGESWEKVGGEIDLEYEYTRSIDFYLRNHDIS